ETVSGAQCLVSWERACLPKIDGGLGVRDLGLQNTCLLMKLLHRAHDTRDFAWSRWLEAEFGGPLEAPENTDAGTHWASPRRLLPDYRLLTTVEVGDGRSTSFWHDCWLAVGPLADALPALFTHARRPEASVNSVMAAPLRAAFAPRLSTVATEEYTKLTEMLAAIQLTNDPDVRRCPWEDKAHRLNSSKIYKSVVSNGEGIVFRLKKTFSRSIVLTLTPVRFVVRTLRAPHISLLAALSPLVSGTDSASHLEKMMCPPCGKFSRHTVCPPYTSMPSSSSAVGEYGSIVMMLSSDRSPHAMSVSSLDVARMRNFGPADCHPMIVM
ncbi:hypothetical protein EJB05_04660, partial [Eragrostis curvula]